MADIGNFDVIVVGGGMSASWAAKEFCDAGLKVIMLERGRNVEHNVDYPTTNLPPWQMPLAGNLPSDIVAANPVTARCYAFREDTTQFFSHDGEHAYVQKKPFDWIKAYQVGGRSLLWARQVQRWSDFDFEGPKRDGFAPDWPIRYKDIEKWYTHVEHFIGVTGNKDGLDVLPDGDFLAPLEFNCAEQSFQDFASKNYKDRHVIYSRAAHLTEVRDIHKKQGRGQCQNRTICERGCPFGGYFSANASTIPWAMRTKNLTIRPNAVVESVIYDDTFKKATGVSFIDNETKERHTVNAKVVFMNAGTLNTNLVLLNSKSDRFPNGIGNDHGILGKYMAFHNYRARVTATIPGMTDAAYMGRKPVSQYMPRFKNVYKQEEDFKRGYAVFLTFERNKNVNSAGLGQELIDNLNNPTYGPWTVFALMMGETLPKETSTLTLDPQLKDQWGIPQLVMDIDYDDNDELMIKDFFGEMQDMFTKAGFENINTNDTKQAPGLDIHEMGGVRMGSDSKTSMVNANNQLHLVDNVFVTDGACMTSISTQNPSLTFMAMTARAANYAIENIFKVQIE
jgi:choline dehydrogenase-like flavoprotein